MTHTRTNTTLRAVLVLLVLVCVWVGTVHAQDESAPPESAVSAVAPSVWLRYVSEKRNGAYSNLHGTFAECDQVLILLLAFQQLPFLFQPQRRPYRKLHRPM